MSAPAIFHHVGTFSDREMNRFGAPSLITRTTNDVTQVQMLVRDDLHHAGRRADHDASAASIMAMREDVGLSWLLLVCVPVLVLAIGSIVIRMVPQFRLMQARIDIVNRVLREQITGIRVVRAFVREPQETAAVRRGQRRSDRHRHCGSAG